MTKKDHVGIVSVLGRLIARAAGRILAGVRALDLDPDLRHLITPQAQTLQIVLDQRTGNEAVPIGIAIGNIGKL